ncbi:winged helix-turn-helix domain-containing protein [Solirubrobacter sp. CPCC 204708]|uniref:Winged helix-turn-helix domain-containing protein n=1 Tax=Solirubrobacter deserti TaxID=2282478 RepID=A0ABT4RFD2_9ACTN|nr:BTAD domain-containing putative transcriptional regulator [Solirubrobacter deserti]MBE2318618.1 winged helix-turn-helix domain-containing protein [Solirubrobacter deserti]MDA0137076.1 winged helix-turn-helix domain-containing protein [Solirubrobacter deserti]
MNTGIQVNLLGPLEVVAGDRRVEFEGPKQRRLFVALALRAPEPVNVDALVDTVWGDQPPEGRDQALQKQVSRLRARLGEALPVRRKGPGYALEIDRDAIDSRRFEALSGQGEFAAGLALWRGDALADHRFDDFAQGEIERLEELRLEATEEHLAAELERGQAGEKVAELRALVAEHPLRERLRGRLMLALYRTGRQAEALEVMREGRRRLVDELGLEPGPELRRLEAMILAHDPGLDAETPANVLAAPLPAPANATIGREGELAEIAALLTGPNVRLLTLVGAGGVGKTRLAVEAARAVSGRFPGGIGYVDLAGVDARLVPAVAGALGLAAETPAELGDELARTTSGAKTLLVLDGFEHFLRDAGQVAPLLTIVGHLTVLVTSRAPLRLTVEHAYRVEPLAVSNAAALFKARVAASRRGWSVDHDEAVVTRICERLDGLPLAIELAADRARLLSLPALLERLEHRLELLSCGPRDLPDRQRSLRATLEWSWEVLDPPHRTLLSQLSVFEGGASLEAVLAVCDAGAPAEALLAGIMDRTSLVIVDAGEDAQPRIAMLDSVREFAASQAEDLEPLVRRHATFFLTYAERAALEAARTDRRVWLARLARERGNLRLAFERSLRAGASEYALRIAIAFARTLPWDAHAHEVRTWLKQALAAYDPGPSVRRAAALYWDGQLAISQGRFAEAEAPLEQALTVAQDLGDAALVARVLTALGRRAALTRSPAAARLCDTAVAIARGLRDPGLLADALLALAGACERAEDWERAIAMADEAYTLYRRVRDLYGVATALGEQGFYDLVHGRMERAEQRLGEAVELRRRLGDDRCLVEPLLDNAWLDLVRGSGEAARRGFEDCLALARHVGDQFNAAEALAGLSAQAALDGRHIDAARLAGTSAELHEKIGAPAWASVAAIHERALSNARLALGEAAYSALEAEGRRVRPSHATGRFRRVATTVELAR